MSATTPEGRVKVELRKFFKDLGHRVFLFWPMQNGMGSPGLDIHGTLNGRSFAIEVKAGKKDMTPRQKVTAHTMEQAGTAVFLINEEPETWLKLKEWVAMQLIADGPYEGSCTIKNTPSAG